MKYLFLLGFTGPFIFSCSSELSEEQVEELIEIDSNYCHCDELTFDELYNHFYRFERRKPYTGKCEDFYPGDKLKLEKNFLAGKVHGKMTSYHENGQIWEDQEFDMNFQEGKRIIYTQSGQIKFHALYKHGKQLEVLEAKPWLTLED